MLDENVRLKINDLNLYLIDELKKVSDENENNNNYFVEKMLYFLNEKVSDIRVQQFSYVETINMWLTSIDDMEELINFNEKVNGDLSNSFIFEEIDCDLCFIEEDKFIDFVKEIVYDDEEIIELNKYLIKCLYGV